MMNPELPQPSSEPKPSEPTPAPLTQISTRETLTGTLFRPKQVEVPPCLAHLLSFSDAEKLGQVLLDLEWTVEEEFTKMVEVARNGSGKERLTAIKQIRDIKMQVEEDNGMRTTHTQEITHGTDGLVRAREISLQRLRRNPINLRTQGALVDLSPRESHDGSTPPSHPPIPEPGPGAGDVPPVAPPAA